VDFQNFPLEKKFSGENFKDTGKLQEFTVALAECVAAKLLKMC